MRPPKTRPISDLEVTDLLAEAINVFDGYLAGTLAGRTTLEAAISALVSLQAAMVMIADEADQSSL